MATEIQRHEQHLDDFDEATTASIAALVKAKKIKALQEDPDSPDWSMCDTYEILENGNQYMGRYHISEDRLFLVEHDLSTDEYTEPRMWEFEEKVDPSTQESTIFLYQITEDETSIQLEQSEDVNEEVPLLESVTEVAVRDPEFDFDKPIEPYADIDPYVKRIIVFPKDKSGGLVNQDAVDELVGQVKTIKDENHLLIEQRIAKTREVLVSRDKPLRDEQLVDTLNANREALEKSQAPIVIVALLENDDLTGFEVQNAEDQEEYEALLQQRLRKQKLAQLLEETKAEDERLGLGQFNSKVQKTEEVEQEDETDDEDDPRLALFRSVLFREKVEHQTKTETMQEDEAEVDEIEEIEERIKKLVDKDLLRNPKITELVNTVIEGMESEDGLVSVLELGKSFLQVANVQGITRLELVERLANVDFSQFRNLRGQYLVQAMLVEMVLEQIQSLERVSLQGGTIKTVVYGFIPFKVDSPEIQEALKHKDAKKIFPKILDLIETQKPEERNGGFFSLRRIKSVPDKKS